MTFYGHPYEKCHDQIFSESVWPDKQVQVHVQSKNNRRCIPLRRQPSPWVAPNSCFVREEDTDINITPAGDFECGATLSLNMNRKGSFSIPLLPFDFDLIPLGMEGMFGVRLGLGYLLHASCSHNACNSQGLLTSGSFCRWGPI